MNCHHFPTIQAVQQHRLWQELDNNASAEAMEETISKLRADDTSFNMEGASWTNDLSWVEGYANVLGPMNQLSAQFHARFDPSVAADPTTTRTRAYQESLLHLLLLETSCFRYWGQGAWTEYAREIHRRGEDLLDQNTVTPNRN